MSVVPKEDALVMSFAEATRVFNAEQSNAGSFVPATGDAANQAPTSTGGVLGPDLSGDRHGLDRSPSQPYNTAAAGPAAVVPTAMPSREQVALNPQQLVEVRNSNTDNIILSDEAEEECYSNPWFSTRSFMRAYFAEFLGTMILVLWGEGTQAQVVAARKTPNDYLSVAWGWGVGFMLAIYVSSGISGGHINPAVTISLAVFRKFPWRRVPGYVAAQLLGGFTAAAVIFGVYYGPLHSLEGGYASVMTTGPSDLLPSVASTFFSVFTGAALLMGSISAFTDTGNNPATPGLTPLLLGLVMVGIASSFGYQTGFVLNPARDLGPRLLVWATGEGGRGLWLDNAAYGIWTPTAGTIAGALFGNFTYDLLIYNGRESPLNFNFSARGRRRRQRRAMAGTSAGASAADVAGAGVGGQGVRNNVGRAGQQPVDLEKGFGNGFEPRLSDASGRTAFEQVEDAFAKKQHAY